MDRTARWRSLPKVQLHCHLEGTVHPARLGLDPGFTTFREFLLLFAAVCKALRRPGDYGRIAAEYAAEAAAQGVPYAELFVSPSVWTYFHAGLDVRATVAAIRDALDEARAHGGPEVALICDLTRNFGPERALGVARTAVALRDLGVVGVGLGGDEVNFPPALFAEAFALARGAGLHAVAHAGEAAGPQSVRDAVDALGAERIGHGIRALEDPAVVALLCARGIPLEICPTSNRLTGAIAPGAEHPIGALHRAGVTIVIDADDPGLFGVSLLDEYRRVEETLGFRTALRFAENAIEASFAPGPLKAALRVRLAEAARNCAGAVEG